MAQTAAQILDCRPLRAEIEAELAVQLADIKAEYKTQLAFTIIQVGSRADSATYIAAKKKLADKLGVMVEHLQFPETVTQQELLEAVQAVSARPSTHGVIVQMPLPMGIDKDVIINAIPACKDIDGLTAVNVAKAWNNRSDAIIPATSRGIITLLEYFGVTLEGKSVVVVGRSTLVGKPTAMACIAENATVTVCHSKTPDLAAVTKAADIIIVAVGRPHFITKHHVRAGQTIVDVGISFADGAMQGDVHPEVIDHLGKDGALTPVPYGVGQMTAVCLFQNLVQGFLQSKNVL